MSAETDQCAEIAGELAEALAALLTARPQRCGHSADAMCCPYENFPTLAAFFDPEPDPVAFCGVQEGYGVCGLQAGHDPGMHAVPIGGGTDPVADPAVWFVFGKDVEQPTFRTLHLEANCG